MGGIWRGRVSVVAAQSVLASVLGFAECIGGEMGWNWGEWVPATTVRCMLTKGRMRSIFPISDLNILAKRCTYPVHPECPQHSLTSPRQERELALLALLTLASAP